jgi:hypothetical protein
VIDDHGVEHVISSSTNLTYRQIALLFGISKSTVDRVVNHLAPLLALARRHSTQLLGRLRFGEPADGDGCAMHVTFPGDAPGLSTTPQCGRGLDVGLNREQPVVHEVG